MITCRDVLDFLMAYEEGELAPEIRAEFDRHLAACPPCVDYLASYRRTLSLEKQAFDSVSEERSCGDVPEDLVQAILASRPKRAGG